MVSPPLIASEGKQVADRVAKHGLDKQGIVTPAELHWNLTTAPLVEQVKAKRLAGRPEAPGLTGKPA